MPQHNRHVYLLIFKLTLFTHLFTAAAGQCRGTETFEKVSRATLEGVEGAPPLYKYSGGAVTAGCLDRCRESNSCSGFVVDYSREACFPLSPRAGPNPRPRPADSPASYFQKICLTVPACGKAWMLERVVGFEIEGYDDLVLTEVASRVKCAELCLGERNLKCRSAEYHERDRVCRLSRQDRRTQPLSFRPSTSDVHYIENQCAGIPFQQNCEYEEFAEQDLGHPDLQLALTSKAECQAACESEATMNCRSYTWVARAGVCWLSGDDMTSAGASAVVPSPGAVYYQRATCLDLRLSCTVDAMTVKLYTPEPFKGRLFSQDFPNTCLSSDKARTETSLIINFRDPECGTVDEGGGVYSNVVVVQHHPVIQRRGDKAIKLLCLFQAANQTVSDSFNFIVDNTFPGGGVATAIVNATAPSPRIRLRIVDRAGNDINGARLGEELYLRLDLDDDSVYGILARNLVAKSGDNSDSIILLDEKGCPVDPAIFPSLQPIPNSRSLQGKFEAFKFSEDQVVRFQVNVQFCLEECRPVNCDGYDSFGRRKRRNLHGEGGLLTVGGELTLVGGDATLRGKDDSSDFIEYNISPEAIVVTPIANATAPLPKVRLRIVDSAGNDVHRSRLGEELYLRLELDDDSVYGIFIRNLVAKSGDNKHSIVLIDETGCSFDPAIFGEMDLIPNSKFLQNIFAAFGFSADPVVKFQANVQLCLGPCMPVQCHGYDSFGRRKRRNLHGEGGLLTVGGELTLVGGEVTLREKDDKDPEVEVLEEEDHVYHEMPLQKEILVQSSSVKRLTSGLLPEETEARRLADLVCTSREVLIAMVVSAVILQICIILIAIMCVFARRRRKLPAATEVQGASSLALTRGYRRSPYAVSTSEDSANTLKTLRTSLRD